MNEIIKKISDIYSDSEEQTRQKMTVRILSSYAETIFEETKKRTGVGIDVTTPGRQREKSDLVKIFCHYARHTLKFSNSRIGWYLNRHHATILNACIKYEYHFSNDESFRDQADFFKTRFKNIDGYVNEEPHKAKLLQLCKCVSEEKAEKLLEIIYSHEKVFYDRKSVPQIISEIEVKSEVIAHE